MQVGQHFPRDYYVEPSEALGHIITYNPHEALVDHLEGLTHEVGRGVAGVNDWTDDRTEVVVAVGEHLALRANQVRPGALLLRSRVARACGEASARGANRRRQEAAALRRKGGRQDGADVAGLLLGALGAYVEGLREAAELVAPLDARGEAYVGHAQSAMRRYGSRSVVMRVGSAFSSLIRW